MERKQKFSKTITFFFILFFIWTISQFIAPITLPNHSIEDFSGLTGFSDNDKIINKLPFPHNFIYSLGDRMCHQKAERSFSINNNQMPFCVRCTSIWIGITIGLLIMIFYSISLDNKFFKIIIIGIIPIGIDGFGQLLGLWESTNIIRIITGLLIGIICGLAIGIIIDEIIEMKKK